jgi:hypothetical protein
MAAWQTRAGDWLVDMNGARTAVRGAFILDTTKSLVLHNRENRPLMITRATLGTAPPPPAGDKDAVTRRLYDANGALIDMAGGLRQGENYLVVLEGPWPRTEPKAESKADSKNEQPTFFIHDATYPALAPTGCALNARTVLPSSLNWAADFKFTDVDGCAKTGTALTLAAHHHDGDGPTWRFAHFAVSTWEGRFDGPHLTVTSSGGSVQVATPDTLQVRK